MSDIKTAVIGRWRGIFQELGIAVGDGHHKGCPLCGEGRNSHRFRLTDRDGSGSWICTQCGSGDGWELLMKCLNVDFKKAVEAVESVIGKCNKVPVNTSLQYNADILRRMYANSKPLTGGCLGSAYLRNRGLTLIPPTLRLLDDCFEPATKTKMPAILATFSAPDSEALTLHRIYLKAPGRKADLDNCKLTMTAKKPMSGGAVRLFPIAEKTIGIAEGIETAIAARELFNLPVWAALNTSLMEKFEPPKGIAGVIIFADADKNYAGAKAAYTLANRLYLKGYSVSVEMPKKLGTDFLDELIASKEG